MSCMGKCWHCKNGHSFKCCSFCMWMHRLHTLRGLEIENSNAHCAHRHSIFWPCSESFKHTCVALASVTSIYRMRKGCMFCTHHSPAAFKRLTQLTPYDLIGPSFQQNSIMLQHPFHTVDLPRTRRAGVPSPAASSGQSLGETASGYI